MMVCLLKAVLPICFIHGALGVLSEEATCAGQQCLEGTDSDRNVLLQKKVTVDQLNDASYNLPSNLQMAQMANLENKDSRSAARDAQFLIQSSFGPTRESLQEMRAGSYEDWVKNQINTVPAESHREFYRQHVNAHWDEVNIAPKHFSSVPVCTKGSRWANYVFTKEDVGKRMTSRDGQILLGQTWRSDINPDLQSATCTDQATEWMVKKGRTCPVWMAKKKWSCGSKEFIEEKLCQQSCYNIGHGYKGDDCSGGWSQYATKNAGFWLCKVTESSGGRLSMSKDEDCKTLVYMPNPSIWVKDSEKATPHSGFDSNPLLPDVIFLAETAVSCGLLVSSIVEYEGKYFRHDSRLALMGNTVQSPQTLSPFASPKKNFLNKDNCRVVPQSTQHGGFVACGSPGEVASVGANGNLFLLITKYVHRDKNRYRRDTNLDSDNGLQTSSALGKTTVWTMKALQANDQLRQRTAWALSQILVVAAPGVPGEGAFTESWLNFYDIFVRNAFGNFRDILQEVTYNPVMGEYLTYKGSRSYDRSRSYPDENYAREFMQLFTIGVDMLNSDGTVVTESDSSEKTTVPAYTNDNIMNFARVFTGFNAQAGRGNIEVRGMMRNNLDPMTVRPRDHDRYPKPDLYGNFLGDGFPLCTDLPKQGFLAKGARYEFLGHTYKPGKSDMVFTSDESSELVSALATIDAVVVLDADVKCAGNECALDSVDVVKVAGGFYEYIAPTCVHHFFTNGVTAQHTKYGAKKYCIDPGAPVAGFACCSGCTDTPSSWMKKKGFTCENAQTKWVHRKTKAPEMFKKFCNKKAGWRKHKFCALTCSENSGDYDNKLAYGGMDCSAGKYSESLHCSSMLERVPLSTAQSVCKALGKSVCSKTRAKCGTQDMYLWSEDRCSTSVEVHKDGEVSAHTKNHAPSKFAVAWDVTIGSPKANTYDATVEVHAVFASVPSKAELLQRLSIGAFKPDIDCTHCEGEVKAYTSAQGSIDESTVFECDGRFYKNAQSVVSVRSEDGTTHHFRNPPVFIQPSSFATAHEPIPAGTSDRALARAVFAESESLIDHLFHHPNTPVNIGRKLIQRFVTSNPSPAYIEAVANAFKKGSYGSLQFSGKYGDLGATVAAILLHDEARDQKKHENGLLREPMLKLLHFMRSMEYKDWNKSPVVHHNLMDDIGEFPYFSETVFNFYHADFLPAGFSSGLMAPEFEIFTSPLALSLLNGFSSLIKNGLTACGDGLGYWDDAEGCQRGSLAFSAEDTAVEKAVDELDVLLTGGRLTQSDTQIVSAAYNKAEDGQKLQAAQQAIVLTPAFNNLGDPSTTGTRPKQLEPADHDTVPYKAVVMLFLAGGADTYQMLVPRDCKLHNDYAKTRKGIDIPIKELLSIDTPTQKCKNFGINPAMPNLQKLYEKNEMAFVSNIGALIEPVNFTNLQGGHMRQCPSQFSHSHAQAAAQTLTCGSAATAPQGIGGLMADALGQKKMNTASFSVSGKAAWSQGVDTATEILDKAKGAIRFNEYDLWKDDIATITSQTHGNAYCEGYAAAFAQAVNSSETLGGYLDDISSESLAKYKADSSLEKQLHQVARLIATRSARKAERDFFFVQVGGWDHHSGIKEILPQKLKDVDDSIAGFVEQLKTQSIFESVVLATESDFGRTLSFNGKGTDHGWGGNHIIVGGGINGGQVFNEFLETYELGSQFDAGRGRVIPKYPWESMMVPIAEWVGIDTNLDAIFPNLHKFEPRSKYIISTHGEQGLFQK